MAHILAYLHHNNWGNSRPRVLDDLRMEPRSSPQMFIRTQRILLEIVAQAHIATESHERVSYHMKYVSYLKYKESMVYNLMLTYLENGHCSDGYTVSK